jgi:GH15 family glucan-1,4-alpha-glucosidase
MGHLMGRPVVLSNGSLMVGLNEHGLVHDFYYPYVGLDNLTTARSVHHLIGIWVDGTFSWVDDGSWEIHTNFEADALISKVTMKSEQLAVELQLRDCVDYEYNAFYRNITVRNLSDNTRQIRVFMHQVFQISRAGRADTALFVPEENYILDYKGRCSLLIYGQDSQGNTYDQYAIGNYGIEGKEGTFKDAEDGELSNSPIEHGGVDSVMRFVLEIPEHSDQALNYWIVAADSQFAAEKIHETIKKVGLQDRIAATSHFWHDWLSTGGNTLHAVDKRYLEPLKKSLMIIKAHTDKRGGIIASGDSSIYNYGRDYYSYVWPRDGAFALWPLIRLGYTEEPKKFFEFCRDIITPEGYMMHKYQPDRAIGSTWHPWLHNNHKELPIQEDETASIIYMLGEFYEHSKDEAFVEGLYPTLIQPAANFLQTFIDEKTSLPHASYDLWEERFLTSTYTTSMVYQALLVAADFATKFGFPDDAHLWNSTAEKILSNSEVFYDLDNKFYRKGFLLEEDGSLKFDNTLDLSSFYGIMTFGMYTSSDNLKQTAQIIESQLLDRSPSGGCPRYLDDNYFKSDPAFHGNPWIISTLWMAQYYLRNSDREKCLKYVDWSLDHAMESGVLSEQVNPTDGAQVSVAPLVWSHAELANTIIDLTKYS